MVEHRDRKFDLLEVELSSYRVSHDLLVGSHQFLEGSHILFGAFS